jgi:hypothetical protein
MATKRFEDKALNGMVSRSITMSGFPKGIRRITLGKSMNIDKEFNNFPESLQDVLIQKGMRLTSWCKAFGKINLVPWVVKIDTDGMTVVMDARIFGDNEFLNRHQINTSDIIELADNFLTDKSKRLADSIVEMADDAFSNYELCTQLGPQDRLKVQVMTCLCNGLLSTNHHAQLQP